MTLVAPASSSPLQYPVSFQRDFAPAQWSAPYLRMTDTGKPLFRGAIYQDKRDPSVKGRPLGVRFLYNPTTVNVSYSMDTSRYPGDDQPSDGGAVPLVGVPGSAVVSWDLLFDRTFDTWNSSLLVLPPGYPGYDGIRTDVGQLEAMVGYSPDVPFLQARAVWVMFGTNRDLTFYGFLQSFQVVYTHWTQAMIPYRGGVSGITLQVLPKSVDPGSKAAGSTQNSVQQASGGGGASTPPTTPPATNGSTDPTATSQDPTGRRNTPGAGATGSAT